MSYWSYLTAPIEYLGSWLPGATTTDATTANTEQQNKNMSFMQAGAEPVVHNFEGVVTREQLKDANGADGKALYVALYVAKYGMFFLL